MLQEYGKAKTKAESLSAATAEDVIDALPAKYDVITATVSSNAFVRLYDENAVGTPLTAADLLFEGRVAAASGVQVLLQNVKTNKGLCYQISGGQGHDDATGVTADCNINVCRRNTQSF